MGDDQALWGEEDESSDAEVVEVEPTDVSDSDQEDDLPVPEDTNSLVRPVDSVKEVVEVYDQFEEIKSQLLTNQDVTKIGNNNHINKSGWRKIATAFNLSVETAKMERDVEEGIVTYNARARAVAPNGKSTVSSGMCSSNESNHMEKLDDKPEDAEERDDVFKVDGKWRRIRDPKAVNEHNIMATAETRAKNRAISDLVGGGQVSAEEMKSKILEG